MTSVRVAEDREGAYRIAVLDVSAPAGLDTAHAEVRHIGALAHPSVRSATASAGLVASALRAQAETDVAPRLLP